MQKEIRPIDSCLKCKSNSKKERKPFQQMMLKQSDSLYRQKPENGPKPETLEES